ncbi:MAG: nucleotidyl transferase AbiEii/AbiGii toxin family protein [Candidatus Methanomethylophilaceae archaeon]|nr:nucleotidyl transferase AbiEii/AbiGii toxin family protein [Candidatus Methanomethylophilaceae archaeon]MBQ9689775.1 nucleotidyl transferase AbiEii/AbiGii toxin family protein [Candidatus Methanomethylophilaceae archaeon]
MKLLESIVTEHPKNPVDAVNLARQYLQEIVLCGLYRSNFFNYAAFQGGTSLRIFHDLDRFSEDLDFCVVEEGHKVDLEKISGYLKDEIMSYGLEFNIQIRDVEGGNICGFRIKGNTRDLLQAMGFPESTLMLIHPKALTDIKIDIDKETPKGYKVEHVFKSYPFQYGATIMDYPTLFAGKTSAVITRHWKNRVKGRDLYDFEWYIGQNIPVNMRFLESNLVREGLIKESEFNREVLLELLEDRFRVIDYNSALEDISLFVPSDKVPENWSPEHFIEVSKRIQIDDGHRYR